MIYLLVRGLPWFIGFITFAACQWQWQDASIYPWPLISALVGYTTASALIAYRRFSIKELAVKMLPGILVLISMGFAFLLIESPESRFALSILVACTAGVSLEMLWLLLFDPARYPVHGLSRLNMAFMPLSFFFTTIGLSGLGYFIPTPDWVTPIITALLGSAAFVLTTHHTHSASHRWRWALIGGAIGLQIGVLANILPVSIVVHGAIACLLIAIPLRIRRYGTGAPPRPVVAWGESLGVSILFLTILLISRWA